MMVTVHCGSAPGAGSLAGRVQPLILSTPLCSAHQVVAAFSACARVAAVNALQYLAFFNIPVDALVFKVRFTHIRARQRNASVHRTADGVPEPRSARRQG